VAPDDEGDQLMTEAWKPLRGFEGRYEISDLGRLRNARTLQVLNPRNDKDGYHLFTVWEGSPVKPVTIRAHRAVLEAFTPDVDWQWQANHRNGVRNDNRLVNLERVTCSANHRHAFDVLGRKAGNETPVKAVKGSEVLTFSSITEAERAGFHRPSIHLCLKGAYKHHRGYAWTTQN
jgi:hypothetical protein